MRGVQCVITAAGLGTRLLPASKEIPKEMFPVPVDGDLKPLIQIVFEQVHRQGIRDFVMVVGRNKRVIEDYFTPDWGFVQSLRSRGKEREAEGLSSFYSRVEGSNIAFVNQPEPRGFGDAVLRAEPFIREDFLVVGADTIVQDLTVRTMSVNSFLVTRVNDPQNYGVVVLDGEGVVTDLQEKPEHPRSDLAVVPYYRFSQGIFDSLKGVAPDSRGEVQLTDGIRHMMESGVKFRGIVVERVWDLGNIQGYVGALRALTEGR